MTDDALRQKLLDEAPTEKISLEELFKHELWAPDPEPTKEAPVGTQTTTVVTDSTFKLPDITPAQIQADVVFLVGLAATFGLKIDGDTSTSLTAAAIAAFALINAVHKLADAYLRGKRADNADKLKS